MRLKTQIFQQLLRFPWTHSATIRLPKTATPDDAYKSLATLARQLSRELSCRVAAVGCHNALRTPHLHALITADRPHRLAALTPDDLEKALAGTELAAHRAVQLDPVDDLDGAVDYLLANFTRAAGLIFYARRTLDKLEGHPLRRPGPPQDPPPRDQYTNYRVRLLSRRTGQTHRARLTLDSAQLAGTPDVRQGDRLTDLGTSRRFVVTGTPRNSADFDADRPPYLHVILRPASAPAPAQEANPC